MYNSHTTTKYYVHKRKIFWSELLSQFFFFLQIYKKYIDNSDLENIKLCKLKFRKLLRNSLLKSRKFKRKLKVPRFKKKRKEKKGRNLIF